MNNLYAFDEIIDLLKQLIQTPSVSRDEANCAEIIRQFLKSKGVEYSISNNNTWFKNRFWSDQKPTVLFNSHIDTVKVVDGWTFDPFGATEEAGSIYGLGSNDAGGSLISLLAVALKLYNTEDLPYNLIFAATAEEEVSGANNVASILSELGEIKLAIVGEPTQMKLAIAEKGLLVLECEAKGKAGHAARNEGVNAIYIAMDDIALIRNYKFSKISPLLGEVKLTVTQIEAGYQHNVVPDKCKFVVDVRTNELYSNEEVANAIKNEIKSEVSPRSLRLNSSGISIDHPIVQRANILGIECFGSPTLSDQSVLPFDSVKIGPGNSARSHTANEYITRLEIEEGIATYLQLLDGLCI